MKVKLIGQGSYGCVYNPGFNCDSKIHPGYVSKLVLRNKTTMNEHNIGLDIKQKIKKYDKYFIIQEKKCSTTRADLSPTIFNKDICKVLRGDNDKYMILRSKYVKSVEAYNVIGGYKTLHKILQFMYSISKRIYLLEQADIIHMDMHFANILIGTNNKKIYVIDFGLSLNTSYFFINKLPNYNYLEENIFNPKMDWAYWTIEYNLLGYIVRQRTTLTKKSILKCITEHYNSNSKLMLVFPNKEKYISRAFKYFKRCIKGTKDENVIFLLSMCKSWDYYKLAIHVTSFFINNSITPMPLLQIMLAPDDKRLYGIDYIKQLKLYNRTTSKRYKIKSSGIFDDTLTLSIKDI